MYIIISEAAFEYDPGDVLMFGLSHPSILSVLRLIPHGRSSEIVGLERNNGLELYFEAVFSSYPQCNVERIERHCGPIYYFRG
jgi:hypothetical protein